MDPILVTGATGRHGATGRFVVQMLHDRGVPVRALVRGADSTWLEDLGAEVVHGDLMDRRSLVPALRGLTTAYFTYPIAGGMVEAAANFAAAGREAGLQRLVVMSMAAARPDSPSHLGRAQWLAEEVLTWAGFSCISLRIAAFFFENLELLHGADVADGGVIRNSFADVGLSWMAGEDAARLAVAALLHPERFPEGPVYPTGAGTLSHAEIAALLGRRLGRTLSHETISREAWRDRLIALGESDRRINPDMAGHISSLGAAIGRSHEPNDLFEELTGERPRSLEEALSSGSLTFGRQGR